MRFPDQGRRAYECSVPSDLIDFDCQIIDHRCSSKFEAGICDPCEQTRIVVSHISNSPINPVGPHQSGLVSAQHPHPTRPGKHRPSNGQQGGQAGVYLIAATVPCRGNCHQASPSILRPRATIRSMPSGKGRWSARASVTEAVIQVSISSGSVRTTGIALGWMAPTSAFGSVVRKANRSASTSPSFTLRTDFHPPTQIPAPLPNQLTAFGIYGCTVTHNLLDLQH